jgi:hypothetical protein
MTAQYLSEPEIVSLLRDRRRGFKSVRLMLADIERVTGMVGGMTLPHLFNILNGHRSPNECVLRYLGGSTANVYQIYKPSGAKRKARKS